MSSNALTFESIELNMNDLDITSQYGPQARFGIIQSIPFGMEDLIVLDPGTVGGSSNKYQWFKNGSLIPGANDPTLEIESATEEDEGFYILKVTNDIVVGLTIDSEPIALDFVPEVPLEGNDLLTFSIENKVTDEIIDQEAATISLLTSPCNTLAYSIITFKASDGAKVYTGEERLFSGISVINLSSLPVVTVISQSGEAKDYTLNIEEYNLSITPTFENVACKGDTNSSINFTVIAQTENSDISGLLYIWKKDGELIADATTNSLENIGEGVYEVFISYPLAGTCGYQREITIQADNQFTGTLALASKTDNTLCEGSNGAATVTVQNPNAVGYTYNWQQGGSSISSTASISGVAAGSYTAVVTDIGTGCKASTQVAISSATTTLDATLEAVSNTHCVTPNGIIRVKTLVVNGVSRTSAAGYDIEWSTSPAFTTVISKISEVTARAAGTYYFKVKELSTGCASGVKSVILTDNLVMPTITVSTTANTSCRAVANGTATVEGLPEKAIVEWLNATDNSPISNAQISENKISQLASGSYIVKVTNEATGCFSTQEFTIANQQASVSGTFVSRANTNCGSSNGLLVLTGYRLNNTVQSNLELISVEWSNTNDFQNHL